MLEALPRLLLLVAVVESQALETSARAVLAAAGDGGVTALHVVQPSDEQHRRSALRIRAIRKTLGMRQLEFAFYLKVAQNTVSAWENGKTLPSGLAQQAIRNLCAEHGLDLNTMRRFG